MYATIKGTVGKIHKGIPTLEQMQAVVGGMIETAFRVSSPTRKNVEVDVFVNEEGILMDLPVDNIRVDYGSPLFGNIVIVAANTNTGNSVPATMEEIQAALNNIGKLSKTLRLEDFESGRVQIKFSDEL